MYITQVSPAHVGTTFGTVPSISVHQTTEAPMTWRKLALESSGNLVASQTQRGFFLICYHIFLGSVSWNFVPSLYSCTGQN